MTTRWYVVRSKFQQEVRARINIADQGFATFFPQYNKRIRHARAVENVVRPLFPGYLFVSFDADDEDRWPKILRTRSVATILGMETSRHPLPLPAGFVEALERCARAGLLQPHEEGAREFKPKEMVRIEMGPFAGFEAIVDEDEGVRVKVLLDFLGKSTSIPVPREHLTLSTRQ